MSADTPSGRGLRSKYLDWCSARIAEQLVRLTPEEMYRLVEADDAEREPFAALVQRATEVLLERMQLPTFEEWEASYREAPERYEPELLGFQIREGAEENGED